MRKCQHILAGFVLVGVAVSGRAVMADEKPVPPPPVLAGKWRLEVKDEKASRTSVYDFQKDGRIVIRTELKRGERTIVQFWKSEIRKVEGDLLTVVDTAKYMDGDRETELPEKDRKSRTIRFQVKGDELSWTRVGDKNDSKTWVLTRVKE